MFGEATDFLHMHVVQAVFAGGVGRGDDEAGGVHVVEGDVHTRPVEEGAAFAEVRGAAVWIEDEVVGTSGDGEGVGHCDGAIQGLHEGRVPGCHLAAALLRDERHGEFIHFGRGVDREADMGGEFRSNGASEGLLIESVSKFLRSPIGRRLEPRFGRAARKQQNFYDNYMMN